MMILLALLGCNDGVRCDVDQDCQLGEMCYDRFCTPMACTSSLDCAMEEHCTPDRLCVYGCETEADCYPGDVCLPDGSCALAECSTTALDCGWREECVGGSCEPADEAHCLPCEDDDACGEGLCWSGYCGLYCSTRDDCPAGFDCADVKSGSAEAFVCVSACWLYE